MGRPVKPGLSWFRHYTTDKSAVTALKALHGLPGYAFYYLLRESIYGNGGSLDLSDPVRRAIYISGIPMDEPSFMKMLSDALMLGIFDRLTWEESGRLISNDIIRDLEGIKQGRKVDIQRKRTGSFSTQKTPVIQSENRVIHPENSKLENPTQKYTSGRKTPVFHPENSIIHPENSVIRPEKYTDLIPNGISKKEKKEEPPPRAGPPPGVSRDNFGFVSEIELDFEEARKLYPGTKRGHEEEWRAFMKRNRNRMAEVVKLIGPAIQREITHREKMAQSGRPPPYWKHFKTWIADECWTHELEKIGEANGKTQSHRLDDGATRLGELRYLASLNDHPENGRH